MRIQSRRLDTRTLTRRKLLHTAQVVAVWPLLTLDLRWLIALLAAACVFVALTQRRPAYASLALLTLLALTRRLATGGAWVVFTLGDGLAALVGRPLHGPRLPWNGGKSWAGSLAFLLAAAVGLFVLLQLRDRNLAAGDAAALSLLTATVGAIVESLDVPLDDNYSVIVAAGVVLQLLLARSLALP